MLKRVYMSPSAHGKGNNVCLHKGCYEDKHTRPIVEVCAKHLRNSGVEVMIAKDGISLAERCAESNKFGADLHVPVHTNANNDPSARYLMFMFYADNEKYRTIFNAVAPELEAVYPGKKKALFDVRKGLIEVNSPAATTLYCELGFHTNETDCRDFIHNPEAVGKALARGICKYLEVVFCEETPVEAPEESQETGYTLTAFIRDVQKATGAKVDGIAGPETLSKTPTVSRRRNNTHAVVAPIQKRLYALGYTVVGEADGEAGAKFDKAMKAFQKANGCVADGEATAKQKTWRKLLGMK